MGEAAPIMTSLPSLDPMMMTQTTELPSSFNRRIEFHLARKSFTGFTSNGVKGGFQLETLNPSSSGPGNPNQGPEVQKGKSELVEKNGLDQELLSFRINFRRIGAGLQNLGNTCFLNSVLQCLTYTEPLAAYLQSGKHQNSCRTAGFCALCAIQKHVSRALNSNGRILAPKDLVSNLRCISRSFRNARQEDAHEYMVNLLESMHKCCLPSGVPSESPSAYERSLVHKIFGGRLRSQVKCQQCSYCSNKFDPFLDLSLEINKADSLHKALTHFTAKEQLDGGERQYQCQQCKQKVRALKQLTIYQPPHVLTVHLKRFGSHIQGHKIDKKIAFGPTLDLKPFVSGPYDGDLKYTLYGVLVHAGWSTHSGHYYSFVRTSTGMWYSLDDNQVAQVNERKVLEQKAYMLFYVRDQRSFVPKKPVDLVQKENMFLSSIGNNAASNNKLGLGLKEAKENGSVERKSNVTFSHAAAQVDASKTSASVELPIKKAITMSDNCTMAENSSSLQRDAGTSTTMLSEKDLILPTLNGGESAKQTAISVKASNSTLHTSNDIKPTVDVKNGTQNHINSSTSEVPNFNIPQSASQEKSDSCAVPNSCNADKGANRSAIDTVDKPADEGANISAIDTVDRPLNVNIVLGASGELSTGEGTDPQKHEKKEKSAVPPQKTSSEFVGGGVLPQSHEGKSQDGSSSKLCDNANSAGQSTLDVGQRPRLPTRMKNSSQKKALDKKPHLAVKKKLFKCNMAMAKMHLTTNFIFGSNLRLHKRKKKKRSRVSDSENKDPKQEHLSNGNDNDADLGPSSSVNSKKLSRGLSSCSNKRKGDSLVVKDVTESGDLKERIDEEFRERVGQNGTLLSTDKQPQTGHTVAHHSESREPTGDKRKDVSQNGFMSILTRGLEETIGDTIIPKWDDVEYPATGISRGISRESGETECVRIGYVPDEWDEEYDRGKRKKVRTTKVDFSGPNLFQEVASKKVKRKKSKLESSSRNEPFRI